MSTIIWRTWSYTVHTVDCFRTRAHQIMLNQDLIEKLLKQYDYLTTKNCVISKLLVFASHENLDVEKIYTAV